MQRALHAMSGTGCARRLVSPNDRSGLDSRHERHINYKRPSAEIQALPLTQQQKPVRLSVITATELLHGVHRADSTSRPVRRSTFVEYVLSLFPIIDFDLAIARLYGELWATLEKQGKRISAHDLIIGATALAHDDSVA